MSAVHPHCGRDGGSSGRDWRHRKATPELRAEVAYRGFATAGELRHAAFETDDWTR
jgi:hypothetical protein